jgi:hypothetical protein
MGGMHFAAGTIIPAELSKSVDAKKAKSGDPVVAKVSQDLLSNGQIVIPRGAKVMGHVTEAQGGKKGESSSLGIAFDKIIMKDGKEVPLQATIQAMARPQQSAALTAPNDPTAQAGGQGQIGNIGGGTAGRNPGVSGAPGNGAPVPAGADVNAGGANAGTTSVSLNPGSQGAIGMEGVTLSANGQATMVNSSKSDVKLDGGTQLILRAL